MNGTRSGRVIANPRVTRELLASAGIHPRRALGQNFLIDSNVLAIIEKSAALTPEDVVIEIGPGLGALTQLLVSRCAMVFAIESDPRLASLLRRELGDASNLEVVEADAARYDLDALAGDGPPERAKMVSNLPYGIAATLVVDALESRPWIAEYTVMVQREVAERMAAAPHRKDYSAASVKIQCRASVRKVASVSRNSFYPRPQVDSTIVRIERFGPGNGPRISDELFFGLLVSAAFGQRRKKLTNSLSSDACIGLARDAISVALARLGREENSRAEDLSPVEFAELSNMLAPEADA